MLAGPFSKDQHAQFDEIEWLLDRVNDDTIPQTMIDVGAHLGNVFKSFASQNWTVHAVEPYQPHFNALSQKYHSYENVSLYKVAISDTDGGKLPFYASYESSGINTLTPFRSSHRKIDEVESRTLAHLIEEYSIEQVDFLKVDTEGHDLMALKGFPWQKLLPRIVICEFEDAKTEPIGYTMKEMAEFLERHGYSVLISEWYPIIRYGVPHDWHALKKFPASLPNKKSWGNLVAIRDLADLPPLMGSAPKYCSFYDEILLAKSIHGANPEQDSKVLGALLEGMRIVVFGAGGSGLIALRSLRRISCEVVCFADNDPRKQGSKIEGIPIVEPLSLLHKEFDLILIASDYAQEIYRELVSMNLPDDKIRVFHVCIGFEGADG